MRPSGPPGRALAAGAPLTIDCVTCPVAGSACDGCMVGLLSATESPELGSDLPLDPQERWAVATFLSRGLITAEEAGRVRAHREALPISVQRPGERHRGAAAG